MSQSAVICIAAYGKNFTDVTPAVAFDNEVTVAKYAAVVNVNVVNAHAVAALV